MELYFQKLGSGPALFILHGLYGSSDNWISIARHLSVNYTVFLVDQRNHGRSGHSNEHTYLSMSSDLEELLNKEGIEKAFVLGHSMGGKTAMLFAALHPNRVNGLVVVDIAPVSYTKVDDYSPHAITHLNIIQSMLAVDFKKYTSRVEIDDVLEQTVKDIAVRQFIMKNVHRNADGSFCWKLNIEVLSRYLPEILNSIHLEKYIPAEGLASFPVLFIRGGMSDYLIPEYYPEIKKNFPDAHIETIPNAGHWVHAEQPALFIKAVEDFLRGSDC
jgi:esterase